jgi:hypothetical protein
MKQNLSPQARRAKAARDLAYAKTPGRRAKKAENQRSGVSLRGKDYDHTKSRFVSVKANRGNYGKGTK